MLLLQPMRMPLSKRLLFLFLVVAAVLVVQETARAGNLLVYNNNDSGAGSLRQAIADNATLGGGNNIVFSNTVTGTITLGSELLISNGVTIVGPGDKVLTVSGNNAVRVFHITNNVTATIAGLTVAFGFNGVTGGAILQDSGSLTLTGCTISSNAASGYGGGIYAAGSLTLSNCTIFNNTAEVSGGGIFQNSGALTVDNSMFSQNSTGFAAGGGILYSGNKGLIRNCTVAANHGTSGGGLFNGGTMVISNCTFSGNTAGAGGGIDNTATASVRNTIVAGNGTGASGSDCSGTFISAGYNFIGIADGSSGWGAAGDQTGTAGSPINPQLGPLQDNGGPTFTMALSLGSPALDKGNGGGIATDQRGATRPYDFSLIANATGGDGSDIGAFELSAPTMSIQQVAGNAVISWPRHLPC